MIEEGKCVDGTSEQSDLVHSKNECDLSSNDNDTTEDAKYECEAPTNDDTYDTKLRFKLKLFQHKIRETLSSCTLPSISCSKRQDEESIQKESSTTSGPPNSHLLENDIIGIFVEGIDGNLTYNKHFPNIVNPFLCFHIYDETTGRCLSSSQKVELKLLDQEIMYILGQGANDRNAASLTMPYTTISNESILRLWFNNSTDFLLMPPYKNANGMVHTWNQHVLIEHSYQTLLNGSMLILIELFDMKLNSSFQDAMKKNLLPPEVIDINPLAWAFLRPISRSGNIHIGMRQSEIENTTSNIPDNLTNGPEMKKCRLQLYKYQRHFVGTHKAIGKSMFTNNKSGTVLPNLFDQYKRKNRKSIELSITINIGPTTLPTIVHSMKTDFNMSSQVSSINKESNRITTQDMTTNEGDYIKTKIVTYHWTYRTRAPNQKCIIPEKLLHRYCPNGNIGASSVAFNHKGNLLAIGAMESVTTSSSSHSLKIFNVDNLNAEDMTEINRAFDEGILLHNHYGEITDISWSDDDKYIASTSSSDKTIQVCKLNDKNQTISLSIFFPPKTHPNCIAFTSPWHYNSKNEDIATMMISGSSDGSVQLWGVNDQILNAGDLGGRKHHDSSVNIIRVDCISKRIYTGDSNGCIIIWKRKITDESNIRRGSDFMILRRLDKLNDVMGKSIVGLSLSSEGTQIELGHDDGEEKNEEQHSLSTRRNQLLITTHHSGKGVSCRLHIFDLVSQLMISDSIETKSQKVAKYAPAKFSPDGGRLILSGSDDGRIHIWDTLSGKREKTLLDEIHLPCIIRSVDWNSTRHMIAIACSGPNAPVLLFTIERNGTGKVEV